jgi:hypothetical protein
VRFLSEVCEHSWELAPGSTGLGCHQDSREVLAKNNCQAGLTLHKRDLPADTMRPVTRGVGVRSPWMYILVLHAESPMPAPLRLWLRGEST